MGNGSFLNEILGCPLLCIEIAPLILDALR